MLQNGFLRRQIEEVGMRGLTSNSTIFEKAISAGHAYDEDVARLLGEGQGPAEIFEALAVRGPRRGDLQDACDLFHPLYDATGGGDGFALIEVSPGAARDPEATHEEARRLWSAVDPT